MSAITRDEVARVAALARIGLDDSELDTLAGQLTAIVDAVAKVSEVATPDVPGTSHPIPLVNVMRADQVRPCLTPGQALAMAPEQEDDQFKVPQIMGEEP